MKQKRNVSFSEVESAMAEGNVLAKLKNPNPKYPNQGILVLELNAYVHAVPFLETNEYYFLKTIYPSRKLHLKYKKWG